MLPILLALVPLLGAFAPFAQARRARRRAIVACAVAALLFAAALVIGFRFSAEERFVVAPMGVASRVGQLELVLALGLDPLGAFASCAACVVGALLVLRESSPRRIALTCALTSAVTFMALADGAATLVLAGAATSILAAARGSVHLAHFSADRVADVALVLAAALLFWTLGGSWIDRQYTPELDARVMVAAAAPEQHAVMRDDDDDDDHGPPTPRRGARASLSLGGLPGATVLVDGAWLRPSPGSLTHAPFADVPIAAGQHTIRVHVGAGSDDYYIPRVTAAENQAVSLAVHGATTTFRETADDLVSHDARGDLGLRSAVARRKFFGGLPAMTVVLALVAFAFAARARIFPFAPRSDDPARSLGALAAIVLASRYAYGELAPATACAISSLLLVCAIASSHKRTLLSAELAFAGAGVFAGVPAIGVVHAALAAVALRGSSPRIAAALFVPTRIAVIGALATLPAAPVPIVLALVATLVLSAATTRAVDALSLGALVVAADPRIVGVAYPPLVTTALAPSFHAIATAPASSLPLAGLVIAITAFISLSPRARAAIGRPSAPAWPARVAAAIVMAAAAALSEVEARVCALLEIIDRLLRLLGSVLSSLERAAWIRTRIIVPERAARWVLVPVTLVAALVFVRSWLS